MFGRKAQDCQKTNFSNTVLMPRSSSEKKSRRGPAHIAKANSVKAAKKLKAEEKNMNTWLRPPAWRDQATCIFDRLLVQWFVYLV